MIQEFIANSLIIWGYLVNWYIEVKCFNLENVSGVVVNKKKEVEKLSEEQIALLEKFDIDQT